MAQRQDGYTTTALGRFAHLLGIQAGKKSVGYAEDDKPRSPEDDAAAGDGDGDETDGDGDGDETDGDGDEVEDDAGEKGKKAKKAKKAKADDDSETCEEEDGDDEDMAKAARAGRRFERARCNSIFASKAAGLRPDVAAQLAFATNMSAKAAIGVLEAAANVPFAQFLASRATRPRVELANPGPQAPTGAKAVAAQILAAGKKARGEA